MPPPINPKLLLKVCPFCGKNFWTESKVQKYCKRGCRPSGRYEKPTRIDDDVPTGTVGAATELIVAADLISRGYHVLRALSPHGPYDLLAEKHGIVRKIEVRTGRLSGPDRKLSYSKRASTTATEIAVYVRENRTIAYIPTASPDAP